MRRAQLSGRSVVVKDRVKRDLRNGGYHHHVCDRHGPRRCACRGRSYSLELRGEEGFLGDNANKGAFRAMLEAWRMVLRKHGEDPFGNKPSEQISKKELETLLVEGDLDAAAAVHAAIEDFARELARVIARFIELKSWTGVERLVIGGGFRETRVGELAIARAGIIHKSKDIGVHIRPIRHEPDLAGLIGAVHLAPSWMFKGHDAARQPQGCQDRRMTVESVLRRDRRRARGAAPREEAAPSRSHRRSQGSACGMHVGEKPERPRCSAVPRGRRVFRGK